MKTKGFLKPEISIERIGKKKFWTGIVIGILISFVLSLFFNYSRESLRIMTFLADPYIVTDKEFRLYDLFFAAFATSIGFGFTIVFWLRGRNPHIKKRYLQIFAISNSYLLSIVVLFFVARMGTILSLLLYASRGYDGQLDMLQDFWLLLVLIPVFLSLSHWNIIRIIFRTRKWILLSILFFMITSFSIFQTTTVDRNILNQRYYSLHKEKYDFIDSEFENAKKWGVFFNDTTKQVLRKKYAERTTDLVFALQQAFQSDKIVPLDSLILEKIIIHNLNKHNFYYNGRLQNWYYASPNSIYLQILKHDKQSPETIVLFQILGEQISLLSSPQIDWEERDHYTQYDRDKSMFMRNLRSSSEIIQNEMIQVVDKLKSDQQYAEHCSLLPDINF